MPACLHVALGIAHVQALARRAARKPAGMPQGGRVRLAVFDGIPAHDATRPSVKTQPLHQGVREPTRLVGDDPPVEAQPLQALQQLGYLGKQGCLAAQVTGVDLQQAAAQGSVTRVVGRKPEAQPDEPSRAVGNDRPDLPERERSMPLLFAHVV
jgi:hypothetical protein